jgi:hypothetical protein
MAVVTRCLPQLNDLGSLSLMFVSKGPVCTKEQPTYLENTQRDHISFQREVSTSMLRVSSQSFSHVLPRLDCWSVSQSLG